MNNKLCLSESYTRIWQSDMLLTANIKLILLILKPPFTDLLCLNHRQLIKIKSYLKSHECDWMRFQSNINDISLNIENNKWKKSKILLVEIKTLKLLICNHCTANSHCNYHSCEIKSSSRENNENLCT